MTDTSTLCLEEVSVRYGNQLACSQVSLTVAQGELLALVGPNGAGKSSLSKAITSQITAYDGKISICGAPAASKPAKQKLGLAPQKAALFEHLTAEENVHAFLALWGVRKNARNARQVIADFGLDPDDRRMVSHYSGGMKQRLNIAIALAHEPRLLILDEPNASLDPDGVTLVNEKLQALLSRNLSILLITHDLQQAQTLATTVGVMKRGKVIEQASPQALIERFGAKGLNATIKLADETDCTQLRANGFKQNGHSWEGSAKDHQALADIISGIEKNGFGVTGIEAEPPNLANAIDAALTQSPEGDAPC